MTRSTTKKTTAKKTTAKKTASSPVVPADASEEEKAAARAADTPNPELTDLDRNPACAYCGRDAVAKRPARAFSPETLVCERHAGRAMDRGQEVEKL